MVRTNLAGDTTLDDGSVRVSNDFSGRSVRKVIVLVTEGNDNSSVLTGAMTVRRPQGAAFSIPHMLKEPTEISNATGALPFKIQQPNEIRQVFERIAGDLQHAYLLAFHPAPGGKPTIWSEP